MVQKDYPDWTDMVQLIGTDIMLAIDIQGGYIMVPVDWQSQFVGVYLQPEWTALKGTDKNFRIYKNNVVFGDGDSLDYPVPHGKTLFITGHSFMGNATVAKDADNPYPLYSILLDATIPTTLVGQAGVSGGGMTFPKPIVIPQDHTFRLYVVHLGRYEAHISATAWGYEI